MGVVFAAYDTQLDRQVAVKLLYTNIDGGAGHDRLRQEARSLAQLSHPNVVPVYEVGIHEKTPYLAMELVQGQTLREWSQAQTRTTMELLGVFVEIGRGLLATHTVGVIHRDLKPDNVLIGDDGRPRIVDFGLAQIGPSADQASHSQGLVATPGSIMGTPAYMAPEQWRGQTLDARSDQYAFCVALFECLYGQLPFTGTTLASLMTAVLEDPPCKVMPRTQLDAGVHAAILRGLARAPNDRWPSMEPLLEELQACIDSQLPGLLGASPLTVLTFLAPVFLLLPLVWLGLELTGLVTYSPRNWLFVSGAQVLIFGSSFVLLQKPLSVLVGHPRMVGIPVLALLFILGHRAITLVTGSSIEVMFAYDFLAIAAIASIVTYLIERSMWPMVALMLGLTATAVVFPSWSPRLWLGFTFGLPLGMLLFAPDPTKKAP